MFNKVTINAQSVPRTTAKELRPGTLVVMHDHDTYLYQGKCGIVTRLEDRAYVILLDSGNCIQGNVGVRIILDEISIKMS